MWASNAVLGYWWVLALAIAGILAGVAVYAAWDSYNTSAQRSTSLETSLAVRSLNETLLDETKMESIEWITTPEGRFRQMQLTHTLGYMDRDPWSYPPKVYVPLAAALESHGKEDIAREDAMLESADKLMGAYQNGTGLAAYQAALYASTLYQMAGNEEGEAKALAAASQSSDDIVRYAAISRQAALKAQAEDVEGAAALLRPLVAKENGFTGQRAALTLGAMFEAAERPGDAEMVYRLLLSEWPTSALGDETRDRLEAMGLEVDAPVEAEMTPTEPGEPAEPTAPAEPAAPVDGGAGE
ncbi:MAG: hypothetical protein AB8H79_11545 [Myxococcota bacterium]